jgi:heat shock protein HslJ
MAGPENLMKQEDTFLNTLQKTEQLRTEGIYLIASTKDRQTELVFYVPVK